MFDLHATKHNLAVGAYRKALRQVVLERRIRPRAWLSTAFAFGWVPVDVIDTDDAVMIRANLPGVLAETINVRLHGRNLAIQGEIEKEGVLENPRFFRHERLSTTVFRTVDLPSEVDADRAEAHFHSGVLLITLPKKATVRPSKIKVTTG